MRVVFVPYNYLQVNTLIKKVAKDFGQPGTKWYFVTPDDVPGEPNAWIVDFHFLNPHDSTLFALKYVGT